jgi:hypothetical protein
VVQTPDPAEGGIPTPESVLGWAPCTDYKLSNYDELTNYFQQLDTASSRMKMVNIGKTSEGRDQIMAIVSDPANLTPASLDKYKSIAAKLAHARGLAIGLKNDLEQVSALQPSFDFAVNEECYAYDECSVLKAFINAGKPVFHVEYEVSTSEFCPTTTKLGFSSMLKDLDLDASRTPCP